MIFAQNSCPSLDMAAEIACPDNMFARKISMTYHLLDAVDVANKNSAGCGVCFWGRVVSICAGAGKLHVCCSLTGLTVRVECPVGLPTFFEVVRVRGVVCVDGVVRAHEVEVNPHLSSRDYVSPRTEPAFKIRCVK